MGRAAQMRAKRIIPCLDVKNGRVVKGVGFVDLRDAGDPVELAQRYDADTADEIAFLDIAATSEARKTMSELVARTVAAISAPLIVGGGIAELDDIARLLDAGARKVSINTAAVRNPDLIEQAATKWGSQAIIVAIDARRDPTAEIPAWEVRTQGGEVGTGLSALEWAERVAGLGAGEILLTSMDRDGSLDGYDLELTRAVVDRVPIPVIASGGVGNLEHLHAGLVQGGADAVLAASIFHEGRHTITEAKAFLVERGILFTPRGAS